MDLNILIKHMQEVIDSGRVICRYRIATLTHGQHRYRAYVFSTMEDINEGFEERMVVPEEDVAEYFQIEELTKSSLDEAVKCWYNGVLDEELTNGEDVYYG